MTPREQYLADCAELWDRSDDCAVFMFGAPGSKVALFAGPMTTHMVRQWICFHVDHADSAAMRELLDGLAEVEGTLQ